MPSTYQKKTDRLNRSYDFADLAGDFNPWKLLAAAIVFQAAVDCTNWSPEIEKPCYNSSTRSGIKYRRRGKLIQFINSDWVDELICWQHQITPEAVCEELVRRLEHETVQS